MIIKKNIKMYRLKLFCGFFRFDEFLQSLCKIILFKFNNRKIVMLDTGAKIVEQEA